LKIATTFGASRCEPNSPRYREGVALGELLARLGYTVRCGGYGGLMEAVSKGVAQAGGVCIGIGLEAFDERRPPNPYLTRKIVAKDLYQRLQLLIEGSQLFIAQYGSVGTLNEIFMVAALKYGGLKPSIQIVLLGKEYRSFQCFDANFKRVVHFCDDIDQLAKLIQGGFHAS